MIALIVLGILWTVFGFGAFISVLEDSDGGKETELKLWQMVVIIILCGPLAIIFSSLAGLVYWFQKFVLGGVKE